MRKENGAIAEFKPSILASGAVVTRTMMDDFTKRYLKELKRGNQVFGLLTISIRISAKHEGASKKCYNKLTLNT